MDIEDAPLRPTPIERDDMGRFERKGGATLKNSQKTVREPTVIEKVKITGPYKPGQSGNPKGRPKGSLNKTTVALKEAILAAAESAGGHEGMVGYLRRLAIENSSAFAGLLGKVLPTTLDASESTGGGAAKIEFRRIIVYPGGREEIEGVTPKQLPAPSPVSVENNDQLICVEKPSQNSASDDQ